MKKGLTLIVSIVMVLMLAMPVFAEGTGSMGTDNSKNQTNMNENNTNMDMRYQNRTGSDAQPFDMDYNDRTTRDTTQTMDGSRTMDGSMNNGDFRTTATEDGTMDWGWLGLLGLIGLAGLFNRSQNRTS